MEVIKLISVIFLVVCFVKWLFLWFAGGHLITREIPGVIDVFSVGPLGIELNLAIVGFGMVISVLYHGSLFLFIVGFLIALLATITGSIRGEFTALPPPVEYEDCRTEESNNNKG